MYKVKDSIKEEREKEIKSNRLYLVFVLFLILILAFTYYVTRYVYVNVVVNGTSMCNTLSDGDRLIVNTKKEPKKGDIIVVDHNGKWLIKRLIAVSGDTVKLDGGYVYINGEKQEEEYVRLSGTTESFSCDELTVSEGCYYYLGDNRTDSLDSRVYGPCEKEDVVGTITNWSLNMRGFNAIISKIFSAKVVSGE